MLRPVPTSQESLQNDAPPTEEASDTTTAVTAQQSRVPRDNAGTQAVTAVHRSSQEPCLGDATSQVPDKLAEDQKLAEAHQSPNAVSTLRQYGHQYTQWALLKVRSWLSKQEQPKGKKQVQDQSGS